MKKLKFMKKSKKLIIAAALLAVIAVGGTLAYLSDSTSHLVNKFEAAPTDIDTEIEENTKGSKEPWIKNVGKADALVRMKVSISPEVSGKTEEELLRSLGGAWNPETESATKWAYNPDDDFWYWQGVLPAAEAGQESITTKLFSLPLVDNDKLKAYIEANSDFSITVYHEACPTVWVDANGNKISAVDSQGIYQDAQAKQIWKNFDEAGNGSGV